MRKWILGWVILLCAVLPIVAQEDMQTLTASDGSFSLQIPSSWVALENDGVFIIGSTQAVITNVTSNRPDDEDILVLAISPSAVEEVLDIPDNATMHEVATMLKASVTTDVVLGMDGFEKVTLDDGRTLLHAGATGGKDLAGRMMVYENADGEVATVIVASALDILVENEELVTTIFYSLSFDVPEVVHTAHADLVWVKTDPFDSLSGNMVVYNETIYIADGLMGIRTVSLQGEPGDTLEIEHQDFRSATDIALAPDDTLWIADGIAQRVWQVSFDGEVLSSFGDVNTFAGYTPDFVGTDHDGHVFTNSSPDYGDELLVYRADGEALRSIKVSDAETFVWGYTMGNDDHIYVNNPLIGIQVYDHEGNLAIERFAPTYTGLQFITAFEQLSDGSFLMASVPQEGETTTFTYLDQDGNLRTRFTPADLGLETSYAVVGFAELPDGSILVADSNFEGAQLYLINILPVESAKE